MEPRVSLDRCRLKQVPVFVVSWMEIDRGSEVWLCGTLENFAYTTLLCAILLVEWWFADEDDLHSPWRECGLCSMSSGSKIRAGTVHHVSADGLVGIFNAFVLHACFYWQWLPCLKALIMKVSSFFFPHINSSKLCKRLLGKCWRSSKHSHFPNKTTLFFKSE